MLTITTFNTQRDFRKEEVHKDVLSLIDGFKKKTILCLQEVTSCLERVIISEQKRNHIRPRLIQCGENAIYLSPDITSGEIKEISVGSNRSFIGVEFESAGARGVIYSGKFSPGIYDYKRKIEAKALLQEIDDKRVIIGVDSNMWYTNEKENFLIPILGEQKLSHFFPNRTYDMNRWEKRNTFPYSCIPEKFTERGLSIDGHIYRGFESMGEGRVLTEITSSDHYPVQIELQSQ